MLIFLVLGLFYGLKLLNLLKERKGARRWFLAGTFLAVAAILLDSVSFKNSPVEVQRLEQFFEEIIETCSMLSFFNTAFLMFNHYAKELILGREGKKRGGPV
ncbi:MAG: hypothetical protein K6T65_11655 [Peptococcaceae bacterium]|nr:hypothetical protein [Peptococcaceae bacterium]